MIVILLCHERSGSHLVSEFVGSLGSYKKYDEVCNMFSVDPLSNPHSFQGYEFGWAEKNKESFFRQNHLARQGLVKSFFGHLQDQSPFANILVDIKYGHLHNFDWFWNPPFSRPLLLEVSQHSGWKLVHLFRRNSFEAALSDAIAVERKIWHSWEIKSHAKTQEKVTVNVQRIIGQTKLLQKQVEWINNWLPGTAYMQLAYEDFVDSMNKERLILRELSDFLEDRTTDIEQWTPNLKKLGKPPEESVANYEELKRALADNDLLHYLSVG